MSITIFEVQFDKDGNLVIPSQEADIKQALTAPGNSFTDVAVISHGWNNDMDEARTLYRAFFWLAGASTPSGRSNDFGDRHSLAIKKVCRCRPDCWRRGLS